MAGEDNILRLVNGVPTTGTIEDNLHTYAIDNGTVAIGDVVYQVPGVDNKVAKAQANDTALGPPVGVAANVTASTADVIGPGGVVTGLSGLTRGMPYYLGTTAGAKTTARPVAQAFLVGVALSATTLLVACVPVDVTNTLTVVPRKNVVVAKDAGSVTTFSQLGISGITGEGTPSLIRDASGSWIEYLSGSVNGNTAGWAPGSFDATRLDESPIFQATIQLPPTITTYRLWAGIFSGDPTAADDPANLHLVGFRASTSAGDGSIMRCTRNGATLTAQGTGVSFTSVKRVLVLDCSNPGRADFYIDGKSAGQINATLPTNTQDLGMLIKCTTLTAAGRAIRISHMGLNST